MARMLLWCLSAALFLSSTSLVVGREFQPYADNSGTLVGVAGPGYCILASDTRLSDSYFIRSRSIRRIHALDGREGEEEGSLLFGAAGCWADSLALVQGLRESIVRYQWENDRVLSVAALSHLLSTTLYSRRMFPFYSLCVVAGLDAKTREGAIYRYDSIGSFERVRATCAGKGEQLIQPLLDEATNMEQSLDLWSMSAEGDSFVTQHSPIRSTASNMSVDDACKLILRAFQAAAEREITVGDGIEMWILSDNKEGSKGSTLTRRVAFLPRH